MVAIFPSAERSSTPAGWRKDAGFRYPASGSRSYRRMIAFLVVEAAKCSLFLLAMFQTFRRLLYHWLDVRSGDARFGDAGCRPGTVSGFLPGGEGLVAAFD